MLSGFGFDGAYRLAAFVVRLSQRLAVRPSCDCPNAWLFSRRAIGPTFGCSPSDDCPNVWLFPVGRLSQRLAVPRRTIVPIVRLFPVGRLSQSFGCLAVSSSLQPAYGQFPLASRGFVLCRVTARGLCQIGLRLLLRADMR
jgi:hypothetical protein